MKTDPRDLTWRERYHLMSSVVVPRPIALVSTVSSNGVFNCAPYSLFNIIAYHPVPIVYIAPGRREGIHKKDTLVNIEQTREFVVNMVTEEIAEKMSITSGYYPPEVSEFQVAGLTPVPSDLVKPPRVGESPVNFECRLLEIKQIGKPVVAEMVMGEVLRLHIRDDWYKNGAVDPVLFHVIGRMGLGRYARTRDLFEIPQPPGSYSQRNDRGTAPGAK